MQKKLNNLFDNHSVNIQNIESKKCWTFLIAENEDSNFMLIEDFFSEQKITIICLTSSKINFI